MALKASKKDVILNMVYSLGAAVVILGALCKINHYAPLGIDGSTILAIGLGVEALIFVIFAFDPPSGSYKWENVYPGLVDGSVAPITGGATVSDKPEVREANVSLSKKLDQMLADANLDASLMTRLRDGINNFSTSVDQINQTVDASKATQQYGDQLAVAANHMESLNALYQVQLESGRKQVDLNKKFIAEMEKSAAGSEQFMAEMHKLTSNVNDLNKVYGGMLNAMRVQA